MSVVQSSPSSHDVGQLAGGSQVSPLSTTPFPQTGAQSPSFVELQPAGQHPSPDTHPAASQPTCTTSVASAARSPDLPPFPFTEFPHAVQVTAPAVPASGVQVPVNVTFPPDPLFGELCVISRNPVELFRIGFVFEESGPPTANVPAAPHRRMNAISRSIRSRGNRYSGIPRRIIPPATGAASKTVTRWPISARSCAQDRPAGPAPITATRPGFGAGGLGRSTTRKISSKEWLLSTPNCSQTTRFSARMCSGPSRAPRRQAASHGCAQTRPQDLPDTPTVSEAPSGDRIRLKTGSFTAAELTAILNTIPFDLTFVDRDDTVRYFTQGRERIFTRTRAILGRKVQYCHPPSSVAVVERILKGFRSGERDSARFWIEMKGRFIVIEYFALRGPSGEYLGCLEVSQDLTEKRALAGERRILDWDRAEDPNQGESDERPA